MMYNGNQINWYQFTEGVLSNGAIHFLMRCVLLYKCYRDQVDSFIWV